MTAATGDGYRYVYLIGYESTATSPEIPLVWRLW